MHAQRGIVSFLVVFVVVTALAAGAYFLFQKNKSSSTPSTTTATTTESKQKDSSDFTFEFSDKKLLLQGGFADPSVIKFNNLYLMYVNKFGGGEPSANLVYTSKDGINFENSGKKVPGGPTTRAYVEGGQIRLYYVTQTPINPSDPPSEILSATSKDGTTFVNEAGTRIKPTEGYTIEGPSVIKIGNNYRMYYSEFKAESTQERKGARIMSASSTDGLTWTKDAKPAIESDVAVEKSPADWPQVLRPFVLKRPSGGYVMFYNSHSKIFAAYSEDGNSWKKLGSLGIKGADVDGYYLPDGTIRIYHGDFSEALSGVVYTGILKEVEQRQTTEFEKEAPAGNVQPLGSKPPPPPECVGKKATDPDLSESCQMWFKIQ